MRPYLEMIDYLKGYEFPIVTSNKKISYINVEAGFDIETTSVKNNGVKSAFMYIWQIGIGYQADVFYGRTWDQFIDLCERLNEHLELSVDKRLVIYVHNLGYEFQFMRKYFDWIEVFSASERNPIKAITSLGIEFRDSYILSGYSLANTAKNLTTHKIDKLVGDLDYSLVRTYKTPLNEDEIKYCINDVQIILAYINEQITSCGDISAIPMTNTGRVRTYVRNNCYYRKADGSKAGKGQRVRYAKIMSDLTLDVDTYTQLKRAFMGGFTHANARHSNKILENVTSIDFTSSYPAVMVSEKFPMSRFKDYQVKNVNELDLLCHKYAVIFDAKIDNIKGKLSQENYISESKCRNIENPIINNGRIASADSLIVTLTDVDYDIMKQCYDWDDISVANVKYAQTEYLPKAICHSILQLYQKKTELKDVEGYEAEYLLSKGMLNSIYGMSVTDVVKDKAVYEDDQWETHLPNMDEEITNYNESRNRFLYYAWGIWVTAYARRNLWSGILATGDDYVYSDTDSLKILNYEKYQPYVEWFDTQIIEKMQNMCEYHNLDDRLLNPKTQKGVTKMLGVWDFEGVYTRFKTLGAKRYLIQDGDNMSLTVAGLSKQNGLSYMLEVCDNEPLKVFDMFNDELYISADKTGKMTHTYIDNAYSLLVTDYQGVETPVYSLSSIHLESCEFTLSISKQYQHFMSNLSQGYINKGLKHV